MHLRSTFLLLLSCYLTTLLAQEQKIPNFWQSSSDLSFRSNQFERQIIPNKYLTFSLDIQSLEKHLDKSLVKTSKENKDQFIPFYMPSPEGRMELYHIWRDDLLPKKLNDRYPEISVFAGYAPADPTKTLRLDITSKGFRAVSYGNDGSTYYIDPIAKGVKNTLISYYKKDYTQQQDFECLVEDVIGEEKMHIHHNHQAAGDCKLHTFDLALACTGEYAAFHGGTASSVMAEFTTSINRINGLYEKEIGVNLVFVPNTDQLIFFNPDTDPYTNDSGGAMLNENQTTCDNVIGSSNYDIGHVYSTGGGGIAQLQSPCNNNGKARGVTGLNAPVGDPFYIDYVAHEMGHQFGATHTFNNSCNNNRTGATAFEPGSGSTIMAYAGICPPNVQFSSDAYFHAASIAQISSFLAGTSCESISDNGSDRPLVAPLNNYIIPISTPFELTAAATVNDGSTLTYCWEQMDREIANMPPETSATEGPMFRTYSPTINNARSFPSMELLVQNIQFDWEVMPSVARDLNFRCTVRGSDTGKAGCTEEADMVLNVSDNAGPFVVINPNSEIEWTVGETETVSWEVANTNNAPVNCSQVSILLSTDGGYTYPITILENTPNDGQVNIKVPNIPGALNRIRVQSIGNVFFDISNEDFAIVEPIIPTFTMTANPVSQEICGSNAGIISYDISTYGLSGFDQPVTLSVSGLPSGVSATFNNNDATPNATSTLNLMDLNNIPTGTYTFTVLGEGDGQSDSVVLELQVVDSNPSATTLITPANAEIDINTSPTLGWQPAAQASGYIVELSEMANFSTIVFSTMVVDLETAVDGLKPSTVYYWRVRPTNTCGDATNNEIFRFRTGTISCNTFINDESVAIPVSSGGTITSTISIAAGSTIESIEMSTVILHTWIGDLQAQLMSPGGESIEIFDRPGLPESGYGCPNDNIRATFNDDAANSAAVFESTCSSALYAIDGSYQSINPFANFNGTNSTGDWMLSITDNIGEDGGQLASWELLICTDSGQTIPPSVVNNNILNVTNGSTKAITDAELSFSSNGSQENIIYTLISQPSEGTIMKDNISLLSGDIFSQADINNNSISYNHSGSFTNSDSFIFDVEEVNGGWIPNNNFQINISDFTFNATLSQAEAIACFDGSNGSIVATVSGGEQPYLYSLDGSNFQASDSFNGLSANTYTVTVVDNNNISITTNPVTLNQPPKLELFADVSQNNVTLSVSGGVGDLTFSLNNANFQNSNTFSNLANGDYIFYAMDANGCIANTEIVSILINDLQVTANISQAVSCFNAGDAIVTVSVSGGDGPYSYSVNDGPGQNSNIFENLDANDYTFSVVDANGFTSTSNILTILNPPALKINLTASNAQITANATGGIGSYRYSLDGSVYQVENTFTNLDNDTYTVYVKDSKGCIDTDMITINVEALSATAEIERTIKCADDATGIIKINASGGAAPYMYSLENSFQENNQFDNLSSGNYTFTIQDANDQQIDVSIFLSEPMPILLQASTDQATATLTAQGGTAPYLYSMDGGNFQQNNIFENLSEGSHEAVVLDDFECTHVISFNINISLIEAELYLLNSISCAGDETASIVVEVSEGTAPFEFSLDGSTFQSEDTFANLGAGTYTVTVRDADGSMTTASITIDEPEKLILSADIQTNTITLSASGGTAPYKYRLDDNNYQSAHQFFNVAEGSYTMTVLDSDDCMTSIFVTVSFTEISGELFITKEIDCAGNANGEIEVSAAGGSTPYSYSLDGSEFQSDPIFTNLSSGQYSVVIMDNDGIEFLTDAVILSEPSQLLISLDQDQRQVIVNAVGGTGEFSYSIDGDQFQSENIFGNLPNGSYTAYAMDSRGCQITEDFTILINDLIAIANVSERISCHDLSDGVIVVETGGGTNPKEYSLDGNTFQSSNFFSDLSIGEYTVTVRDANGLTAITNLVVMDNPSAIEFEIEITNNNINIDAVGGTGNLLFSIDETNFTPTNTFTNLDNGSYTLYVRDENDCEVSEPFDIDYTELTGSIELTGENLCAGGANTTATIRATGGTPPYTFAMAGEPFMSNNIFDKLAAGEYTFAVRDAVGSIFSFSSIAITDPAPLNVVSQVNGDALMLSAQGGTPSYQYSYGNVDFQDNSTFEDIPNGEYTALAIDANGCTAETNFTIHVTQALSLQIDVLDITDCTAQIAGTILASGMGGTPPYKYSLNGAPFQSEAVFENLSPAQYTVAVQDAALNISSSLATLTVPNILEMDIDILDNNIEINVTGGEAPYSYSVDGGQSFTNLQNYSDLDFGVYEVIVTDANGCEVAQIISISSVSIAQVKKHLLFSVHPNPAKQQTTLQLDIAPTQMLRISLIDILGRTVRTYAAYKNTSLKTFELDINDLLPGTYLVSVEVDGQLAVRKLVVQ